jgi:hypothetical protein
MQKRDEVTASLKGKQPVTSVDSDFNDQVIAVNDYLTDTNVNGPSKTLAAELDTLVKSMLDTAAEDALKNIESCGTPADKDKLAQAKVLSAFSHFMKGTNSSVHSPGKI